MLNLSYNEIFEFPLDQQTYINIYIYIYRMLRDFERLTSLTYLNISHNRFRKVPEELPCMTSLETLYMHNNLIKV